MTVTNIQELVSLYATEFDLDFISRNKRHEPTLQLSEAIEELYIKTKALFEANNITFDNHWVIITKYFSALLLTFVY
jgi:hypothetical protein